MCGITGIILPSASPDALAEFQDATDAIRHRGPDDEGFVWLPSGGSPVPFGGADTMPEIPLPRREDLPPVQGSGVLLGHRRLSILDVSAAGHQPMAAADGKVWIVFNGEVYNFMELRAELADEFSFHTGSDTEVILAAWLKWGRDMLPRLTGMFALAIADLRDANSPRLMLARDPFGIKPLYHAEIAGTFAFASEIKSLLQLGAVAEADNERVYAYFAAGCTDFGKGTLFSSVRQLEAGHWMEFRLHGARREVSGGCFWNPDWQASLTIGRKEAAGELRRLFLENIQLHLRSDVPVGAALSGGIDSSSIVCAIRNVDAGSRIRTFSYLSEDEALSEERWIDLVAKQAGAEQHKTRPSSRDLIGSMDGLIKSQDEPFSSTGIFAQHCVFKLARENNIKVMLDGQGADEILGGYRGYGSLRLVTMFRRGRLLRALGYMKRARLAVGGGGWPLLRTAAMHFMPAGISYRIKRHGHRQGKLSVLNHGWFAAQGIVRPCVPPRGRGSERLRESLWYSTVVNSLPMLLRFEDRNSMAHSVESRVPFLTPRFVEFVLSLPEEYLIGDTGESKSIFREAMRGLTPDAVLDRRDKLGFETPQSTWLLQPEAKAWARDLLHGDAADSLKVLNLNTARRSWSDAVSGKSPCPVWMFPLLCFLCWVEKRGVKFA